MSDSKKTETMCLIYKREKLWRGSEEPALSVALAVCGSVFLVLLFPHVIVNNQLMVEIKTNNTPNEAIFVLSQIYIT